MRKVYVNASVVAGGLTILMILTVVLANRALAVNTAGTLSISRFVVGGGGGPLEAGDLALRTTVGQATAGTVSVPTTELCVGFWCGLARYQVYLPLVLREN